MTDPYFLLAIAALVGWLIYGAWIDFRTAPQMPASMEPEPAYMSEPITPPATGDTYVVAIVRGDDRYIVLYDDRSAEAAALTLGRWACHPELSLTWPEAQAGIDRIRGRQSETCQGV